MKKRAGNILSLLMFIIGAAFLINSRINVTGAFLGIGNTSDIFSFLIGGVFLILAVIIFSTASLYPTSPTLEQRIISNPRPYLISSSIKEHPSLLRFTEEAVKDPAIEREMNHLIKELSKGNIQAGLGTRHLPGTKFRYLRGKDGARLVFQEKGEGYEIVAKASKKNEQQVIDKLREIYKKGDKKSA